MSSVRPILAGDPSRGALSLDTEANIKVGQYIQFFRTASGPTGPSGESSPSFSLAFACGAQGVLNARANRFTGISEHGFIVGKPHAQSWICSVEGSSAQIRL